MITLVDYIQRKMDIYNIEDTENNKHKLRRKFTKELKQLGYWDNAKTVLFNGNHTKIFTEVQIKELDIKVESYLLKISKKINYELAQAQELANAEYKYLKTGGYYEENGEYTSGYQPTTEADFLFLKQREQEDKIKKLIKKEDINTALLHGIAEALGLSINYNQWISDIEYCDEKDKQADKLEQIFMADGVSQDDYFDAFFKWQDLNDEMLQDGKYNLAFKRIRNPQSYIIKNKKGRK